MRDDVGLAEAHRRFGGLDLPASLAGMLCALGTAVLLAGLGAGAGSIGYQRGVRSDSSTVSVGALIAGLAVLLVAFLAGGWVAGRMARYDGVRNGLMTAVWFILLAAIVAGLGAWLGDRYNFFSRVDLPQWFSDGADTATAIGTGLLAGLVMLAAGALGGWLGARYHRRADRLIAATRPGAVATPTAVTEAVTVAPTGRDNQPNGRRDGRSGQVERAVGQHVSREQVRPERRR